MGAGRAGRDDPVDVAPQVVAHAQRRRRRVAHHQRHRQRRDRLRPVALEHRVVGLQRPDPADPRTDDAADLPRVVRKTPSHPALTSASSDATTASCVHRSARRASFTERWSVGLKSAHGASPSRTPQTPAVHRSWRAWAPTPSGVTAPTPVITTSITDRSRVRLFPAGSLGPLDDHVDRVADRDDRLDVTARQVHPILLLDDLRKLGQVERIDVQVGQLGLRG